MYTRLLNLWEHFRSSFWFVPTLMVVMTVAGALLLGLLDARLSRHLTERLPILQMSPAAAQSILSSIVGAMVTSTGVVFSITIVALSLASSQFGSRLIRTYRNRRSTHFTLGIFVSTSLYCILVLASIQEVKENSFVPTLSAMVGILLAVICLGTLVYYIHDMSRAIQAPNVIQSSAADLDAAIRRLYPTECDRGNGETAVPADKHPVSNDGRGTWPLTVKGDRVGYIQAIEFESMVQVAKQAGVVVRLRVRPGDFVHVGCNLAECCGDDGQKFSCHDNRYQQVCDQLRGCFIIGHERTPTHDVRYAFNELVEIAVRALSPGINDPFTAVNCIDRIFAALREMNRRPRPSRFCQDADDQLRVVFDPVSMEECLEASLDVIEGYAADCPMVRRRIEKARQDLRG